MVHTKVSTEKGNVFKSFKIGTVEKSVMVQQCLRNINYGDSKFQL